MLIIRNKTRRRIALAIMISLVVQLTGCWDSNEPDRMAYAQGLGIDYKDGKYIVYLQLMNLSLLAKSESGAGTGEQIHTQIGHEAGYSVEDAIYNLYKSTQRRIHWGHLTYIFLTKSAIHHNGLKDATDIIDRYFETHYQMWIYCTDEPLSKIMNVDPPINMSTYLSRLSDPDAAFSQYSYIQTPDLREVIISNYEPPHEMVIPMAGTNDSTWKGDEKKRKIGYIKGIAVIDNNSYKGTILNDDANGYRWMQKKFERSGLSLKIKDKVTIGLMVSKRKVKVEPIITNGRVQFDIKLKLKASLSKLEENISVGQISSKAKKVIKQEIIDTYTKGLENGVDVYRLSNVLYKDHYSVWKDIESHGRIPINKDSIRKIEVELLISDGGKQRKIPTLGN
ncbi:Ger(x)C family spore germination protein [Bacillus marasmi]|uniref:Ger(x)C family spore germination protein n=1 Tax=Bacillus marasmi TaxID=1926279 RepID=UPI00164DBCDE|nr:Ger(x)C family spore germination protein [Bacillus marasmi]